MSKHEALQLKPGDRVTNPGWEHATATVDSVNSIEFPDDPVVFFAEGGFWRSSRLMIVAARTRAVPRHPQRAGHGLQAERFWISRDVQAEFCGADRQSFGRCPMIAYRAEVWCDSERCLSGYGRGAVHDDHTQLPGLARDLIEIRLRKGWVQIDGKHYCPDCKPKDGAK